MIHQRTQTRPNYTTPWRKVFLWLPALVDGRRRWLVSVLRRDHVTVVTTLTGEERHFVFYREYTHS